MQFKVANDCNWTMMSDKAVLSRHADSLQFNPATFQLDEMHLQSVEDFVKSPFNLTTTRQSRNTNDKGEAAVGVDGTQLHRRKT